jgi:unsaturated rhamnogalacturonyl hydrolase
MDNNGFSLLGNIFNRHGVATNTLTQAPTANNLKGASIYLIVDPDNAKETKTPNYMQPQHVNAIYDWVKDGGVLLLFANDSSNVELKQFNTLVAKFGIQFNANKPRNMVKGTDFPTGTFTVPNNHPILKTAKKVYLKEISAVIVTSPAKAVLSEGGDDIIAVAKVGKGTVFAVGDPWIYNEYIDGRKLPAELENFKAAEDIVKWAISQAKNK